MDGLAADEPQRGLSGSDALGRADGEARGQRPHQPHCVTRPEEAQDFDVAGSLERPIFAGAAKSRGWLGLTPRIWSLPVSHNFRTTDCGWATGHRLLRAV